MIITLQKRIEFRLYLPFCMDGSLKNICADYICCLWIITGCMQNEIMQVSIGKEHFQVQKGDWQWYRKQLKQSSCSSEKCSKQQQHHQPHQPQMGDQYLPRPKPAPTPYLKMGIMPALSP